MNFVYQAKLLHKYVYQKCTLKFSWLYRSANSVPVYITITAPSCQSPIHLVKDSGQKIGGVCVFCVNTCPSAAATHTMW